MLVFSPYLCLCVCVFARAARAFQMDVCDVPFAAWIFS